MCVTRTIRPDDLFYIQTVCWAENRHRSDISLCRHVEFNPYQPSVSFHVETCHFIYTENQVWFYKKCIIRLKPLTAL